MFTPTWKKYLPVIKILLKRSAGGVQVLSMNSTDFQRAAGGRKIKITFSFVLVKGRPRNMLKTAPVAKELIALLLEDETTVPLVRNQDFEFTMTSDYQLLIKSLSPAESLPEA
jgi:hypothetical protein